MKSLNKILNYSCQQVPVNIAEITTPYSNEPFLLYIPSYIYFLDFLYKSYNIRPTRISSQWSIQCILCQGTLYWQFVSFEPRSQIVVQEETNTQWTGI